MVINYQKLNNITKKDFYPLLNLRTELKKLSQFILFSKFNVCARYNNIQIKKQDQYKAAFKTPLETFVTPWSYFCVTCLSFHASILPYVLPAHFSASIRLTSDLAIISILSSYIPIMPYITHFPLFYRHSHMYISFLLITLSDSSSLYTSHVTHHSTY
jgi:hypothetical protein